MQRADGLKDSTTFELKLRDQRFHDLRQCDSDVMIAAAISNATASAFAVNFAVASIPADATRALLPLYHRWNWPCCRCCYLLLLHVAQQGMESKGLRSLEPE